MKHPVSLTERLASHWAGQSYEDIPAGVVDRVKFNILDTLAVALAGTETLEAQRTRSAFLDGHNGNQGSLVWGTSSRLVPAQAALVNGTAVHARDFDDGGGPGHAGATVLPAAIAAAEARGAGGRELIAATVAGYDIGYRTLQAVGGFAAHTDRGWHSTGTFGSFAAAAAAAKIFGLDAGKYADALAGYRSWVQELDRRRCQYDRGRRGTEQGARDVARTINGSCGIQERRDYGRRPPGRPRRFASVFLPPCAADMCRCLRVLL